MRIELPSIASLDDDNLAVLAETFAYPHSHDGWFRSAIYHAVQNKCASVDIDVDVRTDAKLRRLLAAMSLMRDLLAAKVDGAGRASFYADLAAGIDEALLSRKESSKALERVVSGIERELGDDDWTQELNNSAEETTRMLQDFATPMSNLQDLATPVSEFDKLS